MIPLAVIILLLAILLFSRRKNFSSVTIIESLPHEPQTSTTKTEKTGGWFGKIPDELGIDTKKWRRKFFQTLAWALLILLIVVPSWYFGKPKLDKYNTDAAAEAKAEAHRKFMKDMPPLDPNAEEILAPVGKPSVAIPYDDGPRIHSDEKIIIWYNNKENFYTPIPGDSEPPKKWLYRVGVDNDEDFTLPPQMWIAVQSGTSKPQVVKISH